MVLFFHDETDLSALRARSADRPFRDKRNADQILAWQAQLRRVHPSPLTFNSCAVVGSSGTLLVGHEPRGALIDAHDAVFRVNYAPTVGYEEYVGRRTTVWVLAWGANTSANERHFRPKHGSQVRVRDNRNSHEQAELVHAAPQPLETVIHCQPSWYLGRCWNRIGSDDPQHFGNATRLSPLAWLDARAAIRNASGRVTVGTFPSTGALAVHSALQLCAAGRVTVFGFGNSSLLSGLTPTALRGTPCDRYYALGPNAGLERCVVESATACPREDLERCERWRNSRGNMHQYVRGTTFSGNTHDFLAEWRWLESLVSSGQVHAPPTT